MKPWSDEEKQKLKDLAKAGNSAREIAGALDRPRGSVCWQAKRAGIRLMGGIGKVRRK